MNFHCLVNGSRTCGAHTSITVEIVTAADFKKYPDGVLDRVITDHLTNCEVCGELPYARTEPDKK